jgi:hypothetical protein
MTREPLMDDDRISLERRYVERRRGRAGQVLLLLVVVLAIAIGTFFLLGGSADVDTEGDLDVPEVDVDVNAPEVDVTTEEAPPASADASDPDGSSTD